MTLDVSGQLREVERRSSCYKKESGTAAMKHNEVDDTERERSLTIVVEGKEQGLEDWRTIGIYEGSVGSTILLPQHAFRAPLYRYHLLLRQTSSRSCESGPCCVPRWVTPFAASAMHVESCKIYGTHYACLSNNDLCTFHCTVSSYFDLDL